MWLREKRDCDTELIRDTRVMIIRNGVMNCKMWMDRHDRIDYEEILIVNNKLLIVGLPEEKELKRVE